MGVKDRALAADVVSMATKVASTKTPTKKKAAAKKPAVAKKTAAKKPAVAKKTAAKKPAVAKTAAAPAPPKRVGSKKNPVKPPPQKWESRAVTRLIEAGSMTECEHCGERVKFRARHRDMQVICNIYTKGVWNKVEHFHEECYVTAGEPVGPAED